MTRSSSTFQVPQDSLIALALCLVIIYYKTKFRNLCLSRFYVFVFSEKSCSKIISMAEEVALDLDELRQLQNIAKRPRVLNLINSEISNLEKLRDSAVSSSAKPEVPVTVPAPVSSSVKPVSSAVNYVTLGTFSWDQDSEKVKMYISLEGIDEDKVQAEFKPMSLDIKIHDVQGKNYRCAIPKLHKEIVPEKCKVLVKPKRIVITMFKSFRGNWLDIHHKEDKIKPSLEKEKDPMAGIMGMMKNLYEDGDEEMKKTIAKAWTDARSGKAADPLKGL
ncbi:calcyclin-binding protein [Arabidopsis lyrata subsp. lyrata]|nr:calcyclin-binding protein [Arabidopsis lyrata subsp. lyrata]|eukprot:XP_002893597.2 calcyclin-binding protein [Arabidopsis lyrata subsp. lyrata]